MNHSLPFLLIATFCGLFLSCNQFKTADKARIEKVCIERIMTLDDSLGKVRNHTTNDIPLSETIDLYFKGVNEIEFRDCPEQFSAAYKKHQKAWLEMKAVTDKYPELRGEMHDLFDEIKTGKDSAEFNSFLKAIWDTWDEVEKIKTTAFKENQ